MINKRIVFPNGFKLKLYIGKDKKGFYGKLFYESEKKEGLKIDINTFKPDDFLISIEEFENTTLEIQMIDNKIIYEGKAIMKTERIFKEGARLLLMNTKGNQDKAAIVLGDVVLQLIEKSLLPENLFARRKWFYINMIDDEHFMIIRYANLHQHTDNSLLDGFCKVKDLAKKAEYACAITDHGNMSGTLEFYNAMKAEGKQPIIGIEVYVETVKPLMKLKNSGDDVFAEMFDNESDNDNDVKNGDHLILLAKNYKGVQNLFKLTSMSENNIKKKPHVKIEWLKEYGNNVVATSACIGGTLGKAINQQLLLEEFEDIKSLINKYGKEFYLNNDILKTLNNEAKQHVLVYKHNLECQEAYLDTMIEIFGKDDFYIELQNHHFELEDKIMERLKEVAKAKGLKLSVGLDAHYLNSDDKYAHELWLCLQTNKTVNSPKRMRFSGYGYYVHNSDEVVEAFKELDEALDNTLEIADKCKVEIKHDGYSLPKFPIPEGFKDEVEYFEVLCRKKFKERFKGKPQYRNPVYLERMKFEMDTIKSMGWPAYFLIVQDFIAYANDDHVAEHLDLYFPKNQFNHDEIPDYIKKDFKVLVGPGRGSGAGSLVCYCLGITNLDPIEYDLLFERFLNPDRISMPKP